MAIAIINQQSFQRQFVITWMKLDSNNWGFIGEIELVAKHDVK